MDAELMKKAQGVCGSIFREVKKAVIGKDDVIEYLLVALISRGHVLIEDVPGVGKTTVAKALARACGLECKRQQFTPDVMASDITGFMIMDKQTGKFVYKPGVVMTNMLIADEINRTSPKTQSALLEVMEERVVTVDGVTHVLPDPFMVAATQNPTGYVGTYPLPEAQLDRFMMKISMGYPTKEEELSILRDRRKTDPLNDVQAVATQTDVLHLQKLATEVFMEDAVSEYIVSLVEQTRTHPDIQLAASPRASLALMTASRALALLKGRDFVLPEDVAEMFDPVVSHRLMVTPEAKIEQKEIADIIKEIFGSVKAPMTKKSV